MWIFLSGFRHLYVTPYFDKMRHGIRGCKTFSCNLCNSYRLAEHTVCMPQQEEVDWNWNWTFSWREIWFQIIKEMRYRWRKNWFRKIMNYLYQADGIWWRFFVGFIQNRLAIRETHQINKNSFSHRIQNTKTQSYRTARPWTIFVFGFS